MNNNLQKVMLALCMGFVLPSSSFGTGLYGEDVATTTVETSATATGVSSVGSAVSGATSGVAGAVSGVTGSINTSIDKIVGNLDIFDGGLSNTFNSFNVGDWQSSITGDNQLLECLVGEIDLGNLIPSGICSLNGLGSGFSSCLFSGEGLASGLSAKLSSLCDPESLLEGSNPLSKEWSAPRSYSSSMTRRTSSMQFGAISDKSSKATPKPLKDILYPSGKTMDYIEDKDGGIISKTARENPNSSTAKAYRELDVATLEMKKLTAQNVKTNDDNEALNESKYSLPPTPLKVMEVENEFASQQSDTYVDLNSLQKYIIKGAREKYAKIKADTLADYYKQEKKVFSEYVKSTDRIAKARLFVKARIEDKYSLLLFNKKGDSGYLPDISEERAKNINPEKRNQYRFNSMLQMNENAVMKGEMAIEKEEWFESIDRTVDRAYSASSLFRGDIAKKEIDDMLKAVDSAIR